jgi:hypothetical protein
MVPPPVAFNVWMATISPCTSLGPTLIVCPFWAFANGKRAAIRLAVRAAVRIPRSRAGARREQRDLAIRIVRFLFLASLG